MTGRFVVKHFPIHRSPEHRKEGRKNATPEFGELSEITLMGTLKSVPTQQGEYISEEIDKRLVHTQG